MRRAVILNTRSGTAPSEQELRDALAQGGLEADVVPLPAGSADGLARIAERYDVLIAAGGDGTVSTVAAAAARAGKTFGVIPAGTLNHFARDSGIPFEKDKAIAVIAAGHTRTLDIGEVNGLIFINNASIGAYPRMVWERNRARRSGLPRPIAMPLAVIRTWLALRTVTARLTVDGKELIRRSPFLFIGNSEYEIEGFEIGKRPTMTDGRLALYVAPESGRWDVIALPVRALLRKIDDGALEVFRAASISMETPRHRVSVALDGEIRMLDAPLRFSVQSKVLRTIVPAPETKRETGEGA
ncbi:MAG: diacylglycerol kinase family lipid kinase [Acidobacteriota bacterium]|nr:diacylglycerol kinase family lipid kinase [Acidobacteriota bacterium]